MWRNPLMGQDILPCAPNTFNAQRVAHRRTVNPTDEQCPRHLCPSVDSQSPKRTLCRGTNLQFSFAKHFGPSLKNGMPLSMISEMLGRAPKAGVLPLSVFGALLVVQRGIQSSRSLPSGDGKKDAF
jgi:hypothetical protein